MNVSDTLHPAVVHKIKEMYADDYAMLARISPTLQMATGCYADEHRWRR
jgi:hypothetical protein